MAMWPDTIGALLTTRHGLSAAEILSVPLERLLQHLPLLAAPGHPSRRSTPTSCAASAAAGAPFSVDADPRASGAHTNVLRVLYRALAVLQPKGAADSSLAPQALLSPRGAAALEADCRPLVWDLLYNPRCLWSWRQLAGLYSTAMTTLLHDAAMALSPQVWPPRSQPDPIGACSRWTLESDVHVWSPAVCPSIAEDDTGYNNQQRPFTTAMIMMPVYVDMPAPAPPLNCMG